jgi:hypothetical protein
MTGFITFVTPELGQAKSGEASLIGRLKPWVAHMVNHFLLVYTTLFRLSWLIL